MKKENKIYESPIKSFFSKGSYKGIFHHDTFV